MFIHNPNRLQELDREERYQAAAKKIASFKNPDVLRVVCWGWAILLGMAVTFLLAVRIGLSLPLPWHG